MDAVVRKALNKLPDARFHTMEEIAEELEPFAATGATTTTGKNRISIPARGIENAATEQISATAHTAVQSAFPARTQESNERANRTQSCGPSATRPPGRPCWRRTSP